MIDRPARDIAAQVLRQFFSGRFDQFEFEKRYPSSKDLGVEAIGRSVWCFYDDFVSQRMTDENLVNPSIRRAIARWILFLQHDFEYDWPKIAFPGARPMEGVLFRQKELRFMRSGDYKVWPFIDTATYEQAKTTPRLLARKPVSNRRSDSF